MNRAIVKLYLFLLILILTPLPAFAYFKCTDAQGNVLFQALPCPANTSEVEKKSADDKKVNQSVKKNKVEGMVKDQEFISESPTPSTKSAVVLSRLSSTISSLSPIKIITTQYYMSNASWPDKLSDIGISEDEMASSQIDAIRLDSNGSIMAKLNVDFGENKYLVIKPQTVLGGTSIEWQCFANFPKELLNYGGASFCESRAIN